ncbi:hypothetical protein PRIPAC_85143 [Pristionchus pacificus]|uniref:Uncharacterized protein n=1 Tax=Pristionchus pacificus TaxID=54126 RepID=A0A2A6BVA2_PRIPA|nr:hypothetical protein PRIPAC_85143 [Pristionchus pacificus]|eukprot:PDM69798.1 hypothetical protein PRIPAC_44894 [Pristionchus pacificus]
MVDKASGNYAITCKKLYLQFMEKELNTQSTEGKTYEIKDQLDPVNIKLNHEKFTRSFEDIAIILPVMIFFFSIQNKFRVVQQLSTVFSQIPKTKIPKFSALTSLHCLRIFHMM